MELIACLVDRCAEGAILASITFRQMAAVMNWLSGPWHRSRYDKCEDEPGPSSSEHGLQVGREASNTRSCFKLSTLLFGCAELISWLRRDDQPLVKGPFAELLRLLLAAQ